MGINWMQLGTGMAHVALIGVVVLAGCCVDLSDSIAPGNFYKVALTQKGYIQFLRYQVDVPALDDFTACMWIKSTNSSHAQPLLSYSLEESKRLIRVWIAPHGFFVNLEILGVHVMKAHVGLELGYWYHMCQTYSTVDGLWGFYRNGELIATGEVTDRQLLGRPIPGKGDIVIGQEYTDFDKGLEDGIEGEIFGFNMLANSQSFHTHTKYHHHPRPHRPPSKLYHHHPHSHHHPLRYLSPRRNYRLPLYLYENPNARAYNSAKQKLAKQSQSGVEFVNVCYRECTVGRGSPSRSKYLLISWARTPVRVFGGAVMKNANPVCGDF